MSATWRQLEQLFDHSDRTCGVTIELSQSDFTPDQSFDGTAHATCCCLTLMSAVPPIPGSTRGESPLP